jgi:hypothetical protein
MNVLHYLKFENPKTGGPGSCIYFHQEKGASIIPSSTAVATLISMPFHHICICMYVQWMLGFLQSRIITAYYDISRVAPVTTTVYSLERSHDKAPPSLCLLCFDGKFKIACDRRPVGQSLLVSGQNLRAAAKFSFSPRKCFQTFAFFSLGRPLWREDGSVIHSYNCTKPQFSL